MFSLTGVFLLKNASPAEKNAFYLLYVCHVFSSTFSGLLHKKAEGVKSVQDFLEVKTEFAHPAGAKG